MLTTRRDGTCLVRSKSLSSRARGLFSFFQHFYPILDLSNHGTQLLCTRSIESKFESYIYLFFFFSNLFSPERAQFRTNDRTKYALQTALERHVNGHFNQPETSNNNARRSCESGGKLVRRNGKRLRYRRQPWSGRYRLFPSRQDPIERTRNFFPSFFNSETVRLLRFRGDGGSSAQVVTIGKVEDARSSR